MENKNEFICDNEKCEFCYPFVYRRCSDENEEELRSFFCLLEKNRIAHSTTLPIPCLYKNSDGTFNKKGKKRILEKNI